jgi:hypothetical protein
LNSFANNQYAVSARAVTLILEVPWHESSMHEAVWTWAMGSALPFRRFDLPAMWVVL